MSNKIGKLKILSKITNAIGLIGIVLLFLSISTNYGYSETIGIAPIFVSDIILIVIGSIGPIVIIYLFFGKRFVIPAIFLISSLASIGLAYLNYPSVRMESAGDNLNDVERAIENLQSNRNYYRINNAPEYYKLRMKELLFFKTTYKQQYDFLLAANVQKDARRNRLTYFFGLLAFILLLNCVTTYNRIKTEE